MAEPNYKTLYVEDLGGEIQYPSNYSQDQVNQLVQKARSMVQQQGGSSNQSDIDEIKNALGYSSSESPPPEIEEEESSPPEKTSKLQGILEGFRLAAPKSFTALTGAYRREASKNPQKEFLKAGLMGPVGRLLYGFMGGDNFKKSYDKEKKLIDVYSNQVTEDHPMLTHGTKALASIPWYLMGGNALSKAPGLAALLKKSPTLAKTLIGGLTSSGLGYSQTEKTENIPFDFAVGAGGELIGAGVQGAAKKMQGIPKWMMNKVFKPSASEVEGRALKGAPTLGEQVLERGMSGSTDDFMRMAADKKAEIGKSINELLASKKGAIDKTTVIDELSKSMEPWKNADKKEAVNLFKEKMGDFWQGPKLSAAEAQSKKTALYDILQKQFGKDVVPYSADADMAKAIGLKKAIEKIAPEVGPKNKEWAFFNKIYQSALNSGKKEAGSAVLPLKDELLGTALTMKYGPGEGLASLFGSQMAQSPKFLSKNAVRLKSLLDFLQKSRGTQSLAPVISSLNSSLSE